MSKIAGIYWDDTAAAPGISLSVYFSGCHFHCPGCHNPEAQDFNYGRDYDLDVRQEIMQKLNKNGVMRTLSILGGEPLTDENLADVLNLFHYFLSYICIIVTTIIKILCFWVVATGAMEMTTREVN